MPFHGISCLSTEFSDFFASLFFLFRSCSSRLALWINLCTAELDATHGSSRPSSPNSSSRLASLADSRRRSTSRKSASAMTFAKPCPMRHRAINPRAATLQLRPVATSEPGGPGLDHLTFDLERSPSLADREHRAGAPNGRAVRCRQRPSAGGGGRRAEARSAIPGRGQQAAAPGRPREPTRQARPAIRPAAPGVGPSIEAGVPAARLAPRR
jgi:hypothetical protein